jgi:hypothetical protein
LQEIICKKDWYINGRLGLKSGVSYPVIKKESGKVNRILVKTDIDFNCYFWSGSEYFNVDSIFE